MIFLPDAEATEAAGRVLAEQLRIGDVIGLSGNLGAGKTCFARGILTGLGLDGEVPSPSFPIVIPYDPPQTRIAVWHVDLYRLDDAAETLELGLDEALQDGVLLIEWPERMGNKLWPETLMLSLSERANGGRSLTAKVPQAWNGRWPFQ